MQQKRLQSGFTLIEIIVSTAIFVVVVSAMLSLFNYTLKINRRVQSLREVAQGTRAFTETLTREIRNGRIDYSSWTSDCDVSNYSRRSGTQKSLALQARNGDQLCFYFEGDEMYLKKQTPTGVASAPILNSDNFKIEKETFRFIVLPDVDPEEYDPNTPGQYPRIQPSVTILAQFTLVNGGELPTTINYQTTISTDVYDIPK